MGLILAIDAGTTNVKAALVDENFKIIGAPSSANMQIEGDASGKACHDPQKLLDAIHEVCLAAIGERGKEVDSLALTSYMFGLLLADKNGTPITQMSTFVDTSAQAHHTEFLQAIGSEKDIDALYLKTACPPIFQYPINRLHFIAKQQPEIAAKTAYVLDSKSFILKELTGEYVTDLSTANSLGALDTLGNWDKKIIKITGFAHAKFPKVVNGFSEKIPLKDNWCRELGLKTDTPIAVGLYDGGALTAALSGFEEKIAVGNFGTSGQLRVPTAAPVADLEAGILQSCIVQPNLFFTGAGINNCTIATNLLLNVLDLQLDYLRDKTLSVPGSRGVMTFPYFTGERDKTIGNIGTGMIFGLGVGSTRDDLARSFLEGVAFSYLLIKNQLSETHPIAEFRMGGGGSTNRQWMQILADVLNLPIRLTNNPEMGIIGAACLARYGDNSAALIENSRRLMKDSQLILPIAENVRIYEEVAARYFDMRASLREPLLARQGLSPLRAFREKNKTKDLPLVREKW